LIKKDSIKIYSNEEKSESFEYFQEKQIELRKYEDLFRNFKNNIKQVGILKLIEIYFSELINF
jgi:hypothetical protein